MNILEQIIADKRIEIEERKARLPLVRLKDDALAREPGPDFVRALRDVPMGLIAEVKRKSPSAGLIRDPFDPAAIAAAYEKSGASAISCLMDHKYFGGGDADFAAVRSAVELPMLYKEFVVDPWQVAHARLSGASAVLLIAGALDDAELGLLLEETRAMRLQPLVEVHDATEMKRTVDAGADCIGINNRNLKTFETRLDTTYKLAALSPADATLVSESGIRSAEDVVSLKEAGAHAVLVGESLLREDSPGEAAGQLMSRVN